MEPITAVTLSLTFIGVLVIGYGKYYERKIIGGEKWSDAKFGMFFLVAGGVMVFEYFAIGNGDVAFPAEETLNAVYALVNPILAIFGGTIATITGGRILNTKVIKPAIAGQAAEPVQQVSLTPGGANVKASVGGKAFQLVYGLKPPVEVKFELEGTTATAEHTGYISVDVDWDDGTFERVPLTFGKATVMHTFNFVKTEKYTGKTFNPVFKFNSNDGTVFAVNTEDGRGLEIGVEAP